MHGSISLLSVGLINCCHLLSVEIDGFRSDPVLTDVVLRVKLFRFSEEFVILYQPT